MWVFGYGSLMSDGWEVEFGCSVRAVAELHGYRRVFNKASVVNWGTKECPCPTLNLELATGASCVGIAFEFPEGKAAHVEAYLAKREGKDFNLAQLEIAVKEVGTVWAMVPLYTGKNIVSPSTTQALVSAVRRACGTHGACSDYVSNVHGQLSMLGIEDPAVTRFVELLRDTS
ncbi:gamma-glutamylcyclotransferase [Burkholderia ubonensis]|uniref:gamma-glutamylcyclotransferase n=1 Tax=Burkholderia ubonensis TaxID=101571 RepID=UPI0039F57054